MLYAEESPGERAWAETSIFNAPGVRCKLMPRRYAAHDGEDAVRNSAFNRIAFEANCLEERGNERRIR